jgi:fructokinase
MQSRGLLDAVRVALPDIARGYGPASLSSADPRDVLVAPGVPDSPGVVGALALAADLLR